MIIIQHFSRSILYRRCRTKKGSPVIYQSSPWPFTTAKAQSHYTSSCLKSLLVYIRIVQVQLDSSLTNIIINQRAPVSQTSPKCQPTKGPAELYLQNNKARDGQMTCQSEMTHGFNSRLAVCMVLPIALTQSFYIRHLAALLDQMHKHMLAHTSLTCQDALTELRSCTMPPCAFSLYM